MATPQYILAIDYGDKRVGVAIAQIVARLPRPLTTLQNSETLLNDIKKLVEQEDAGLIIVGLPRGMDGGYTEQTKKAEAFALALQGILMVPVELADETLTSVDAESSLGNKAYDKGDVDALAASLILERYFAEHPTSGVTNV